MRAVMLETPESLLEERRRTGADLFDEVWEGVLHMVPPPSVGHQRFGKRLLLVLTPIADARGLESNYETGVFRPSPGPLDYRTPDLVFARADRYSDRGVEGRAELVVEIRSRNDESYEKLPFYASLEIPEALVIDPITRAVELFANRAGAMEAVAPDSAGGVRSSVLEVTFARIDGPKLRIAWPDGVAEI
ncbi:MAG: Uma2 family endonuclease [Deltaproteobacteria bacterium]|nr:Uma2 family endonuclease [Deltaproteobacteria bacterium]